MQVDVLLLSDMVTIVAVIVKLSNNIFFRSHQNKQRQQIPFFEFIVVFTRRNTRYQYQNG
ncbi:hypothetical protein HW49_05990 [Porphyromonadaceae bacterium COT-184 OH4590]|nr:hypothetical protein HW49_05990 [Porphyromonadaceae bacterium COT-184 OH4590]